MVQACWFNRTVDGNPPEVKIARTLPAREMVVLKPYCGHAWTSWCVRSLPKKYHSAWKVVRYKIGGFLELNAQLKLLIFQQQSTTIYDPGVSSTYSKMPWKSNLCQGYQYSCDNNFDCGYNYSYANNVVTQGIVSYETFTLNSRKLNEIAFGCGHKNKGPGLQGAGLVGFGWGPLSLPSQLAPSFGNVFSYYLVAYNKPPSETSPLFIGNITLFNNQITSSTPLIRNSKYPTFYYLLWETITVATQLFEIPAGTFDTKSDGTGGIIIDTGTLATILPQPAYDFVKTELKE